MPSGMPVIRQTLERFLHFHGQLARMIRMHAHPERMIFLQHGAKLGRDALRQENWNSRPDAKKLDVRDRAQPAKNAFELVVAENQGVAAGEKHVAHFGVLFQITEGLLEIGVQLLLAHAAHDAAPRAIPAVTRATIRHEKQNAIRISMHQTRHRHVRILTAGIGHIVRRRPRLFDPRDDLAANRAIRIVALDQVEKMRRDRRGRASCRKAERRCALHSIIPDAARVGRAKSPGF